MANIIGMGVSLVINGKRYRLSQTDAWNAVYNALFGKRAEG